MKFNKKISLLAIGVSGLIVIGSLIYYNFDNKNFVNIRPKQKASTFNPSITWNVFPELTIDDFYDKILVKNGKAIISDDFIAAVIEKVIKATKLSNSDIKWTYKFLNLERTEIDFYFETTIYFDKLIRKKYNFKITENK